MMSGSIGTSRSSASSLGFTVIELLVVMAVMSILAMAAYPLAEVTVRRDREHELKRALWEIRDAIDAYKRASEKGLIRGDATQSGYPPNLQTLVDGVPAAKDAGQKIYFMRRVPRDPFAESDGPPERAWGLRSFQSSAKRPEPGEDVYDVYSRTDRVGLNGVPLREW